MDPSDGPGCTCHPDSVDTAAQRRVLHIALVLNATMFAVGLGAGLIARSTGLLADSLDMLADASAYAIALLAISRGAAFKAGAARVSGAVLTTLGLAVLADVVRRAWFGAQPDGAVMIGVASVSLVVNATVLGLLGRVLGQVVHLSATWIFTKVDVIANLGVIASGVIVALTPFGFVDLIIGFAIGCYVIKEGIEILREAGEARRASESSTDTGARPNPGNGA